MIREMYAEIQKQTDKHSVSELCEIYGVSRSGYYKWLKRAGQLNRYEKTHKILDSYFFMSSLKPLCKSNLFIITKAALTF